MTLIQGFTRTFTHVCIGLGLGLGLVIAALPALAVDYPAAKEVSWLVRDFKFHSGEVLPELRLHYRTVGNQALMSAAPTRDKADAMLNQRLTAPFTGDANDHLYQWDSSRDYNPSAGLERIQATVIAINSADDERNPPENGVLDREIKRVRNGRVLLIPVSDKTAGHGTTGQAKFWKIDLATMLQSAPRLGK